VFSKQPDNKQIKAKTEKILKRISLSMLVTKGTDGADQKLFKTISD
jgi:hypothetical protein